MGDGCLKINCVVCWRSIGCLIFFNWHWHCLHFCIYQWMSVVNMLLVFMVFSCFCHACTAFGVEFTFQELDCCCLGDHAGLQLITPTSKFVCYIYPPFYVWTLYFFVLGSCFLLYQYCILLHRSAYHFRRNHQGLHWSCTQQTLFFAFVQEGF